MSVAIIGGGACGLVVANILQKNGIEYTLFEKGSVGKKILASGNGKANIANIRLTKEDYHGSSLAYRIVCKYRPKLFSFWKSLSLQTKVDEEGRVYPISESSLSVLTCLCREKLNLLEHCGVERIDKNDGKYWINQTYGPFDDVVFSIGSAASFVEEKRKNFYQCLQPFDLAFHEIRPSLVGFRCKGSWKELFGVRCKCSVVLFQNDQEIHREYGEVIFKKDGISGICVLNCSSYYAHLNDPSDCSLILDFFPQQELHFSSYEELNGWVHPKLATYLKRYPLEKIPYVLHHFRLEITETYGLEFAQVSCGGVKIDQVDEYLRLKKDPHLYFGGEILDVDGVCGGYNLMFAFCCGMLIGEALCNTK